MRMGLQILLTGLGAYFTLRSEMTAGGMIAVSILSGKALAPFDAAVSIYQNWLGVKKAHKRLMELEATAPLEIQTTNLPEPEGKLTIEKLTYQAPESQKWILRGINVSFAAGESIGIIGASGCGKTTLARLMVGVLNPTSGNIRLDGAALSQWDPKQLGDLIGYLPQDVELFTGTVATNIARLDDSAEDKTVIAAAKLANVHDFILSLPQGYKTQIGHNGALLSAGQRQRIALARAFYGDPKFVVLDEPNANLDSDGEQALVQAILNAREKEITTILIAHRPQVLRKVDKILVLHAGEAKMFGPADEIMAKMTQSASNVEPISKVARGKI